MVKKTKKKYCGNCLYHSAWEYPLKIFCEYWLEKDQKEKTIRDTLDSCEMWKPEPQGCYCVRDALREIKKLSNYHSNLSTSDAKIKGR
jgi:hypothetical protein